MTLCPVCGPDAAVPTGLRQAQTEKISDIKSLIDLKILKFV
jgi:hypothetical protein